MKDQQCQLCGETLSDEDLHMRSYHQSDTHTCCVCKKQYSELKLLKRHLRVHRYDKNRRRCRIGIAN